MGGFAGVRACLRVISNLHDTAALSPRKVTPKTKGRPQILRQDSGAQTHPAQPTWWGTEQGSRQGPSQGAQPQPLGQSLTQRSRIPAQSLPQAPCTGPKENLAARGVRSRKQSKGWARFRWLCFPCSLSVWVFLPSRLSGITLSRSLVITFSLPCLSHFSSVPKSWHDTGGHSLPFFPILPTNGLPVPTFTSQAIPFPWRLAAAHHLTGARNIMVIGAVSLPNKMALMELLFDLVCFVFFFQRGTIKNQLRHFN